MKEDTLRGMIRKQIKSSLKEAPIARAVVGTKLGSIEKMAGVKMLKKALGAGSPVQQAAGLLQVVQAISGNNPTVGKQLARMLMKKDSLSGETAAPVEEGSPNFAVTPPVQEKVSSALTTRMGRLDKTQAMQMMRKTLANKPASQQAEFVADLVKGLGLKGNIQLLIKKIRSSK